MNIPVTIQLRCPKCSGSLTYCHNKVGAWMQCNDRCGETYQVHQTNDFVQFVAVVPAYNKTTEGGVV